MWSSHIWVHKLTGTHDLLWMGGLVYCNRCGGTHTGAGGDRGLLTKNCEKAAAGGTLTRLRAMILGKLPKNVGNWPDSKAQPEVLRRSVVLSGVSGGVKRAARTPPGLRWDLARLDPGTGVAD